MSDQRYTLIQEIRPSQYDLDCPVEIENGALLVDKVTYKVLLQLRLNILGLDHNRISSVTLRIDCYDEVGDKVRGFHPFYYTFNDLSILGVFSFENEIPVILDSQVRRVEIAFEKVTYVDGLVWLPSNAYIIPPEQRKISTLTPELRVQVNRDIHLFLSDENRDRILYIPKQTNDYWLCTCGRPNRNEREICCRCSLARKWVFRNLSETGIQINLVRYEETRHSLDEESRLVKKLQLVRRKRWQHQFQRILLFALGAGFFFALFFYVGNPHIKYVYASNLLENAEYDRAISIFKSLGEFKDSEEMIKEANYEKAYDCLVNKKFDEASALFAGNSGYRNSEELVSEAKYQKAAYYLANNRYDESAYIFTSLKEYKDSKKLVHEANYLKAKDLLEQNNYAAAAGALSFNRGYKDSDKLFSKAYFLWGMQLMGRNQWTDAKYVFSKVDKSMYPEVTGLIEDAQKRIDKEKKEKEDREKKEKKEK